MNDFPIAVQNAVDATKELWRLARKFKSKQDRLDKIYAKAARGERLIETDWRDLLNIQDSMARYIAYRDAVKTIIGDEILTDVANELGLAETNIPEDMWGMLGKL